MFQIPQALLTTLTFYLWKATLKYWEQVSILWHLFVTLEIVRYKIIKNTPQFAHFYERQIQEIQQIKIFERCFLPAGLFVHVIQVKLILNCTRALAITCLSHTRQNFVQRTTFKVLPSPKQVCHLSLKNRL